MPTLDGGPRFRACLEAIGTQRPAVDALVVIDSGSGDGTPEAAAAAGATVLGLDGEPYDHGATRQRGAEALPDVEAVVFLVQDAVPRGDGCLESLARAALVPGVGAATARQVAPADSPPLTRMTVERSPFAVGEARRTGPFDPAALARFSPADWRGAVLLDDVACAVRGALFRRVGMGPAGFGEDALLAYDLLRGGWALLHEPDAVVEHGHAYDPPTASARYEEDARFFRERFGFRVRPGPLSVVKGWLSQMLADHHWAVAHPDERSLKLVARAAALRWAQVLGQWRGSRGPAGAPPVARDVPSPDTLGAEAPS